VLIVTGEWDPVTPPAHGDELRDDPVQTLAVFQAIKTVGAVGNYNVQTVAERFSYCIAVCGRRHRIPFASDD
jgi:hypothetical protein